MAHYDLDYNVAVIIIPPFRCLRAACFDRHMEFGSPSNVVAVGRWFYSGRFMATAGILTEEPNGDYPEHMRISTCKIPMVCTWFLFSLLYIMEIVIVPWYKWINHFMWWTGCSGIKISFFYVVLVQYGFLIILWAQWYITCCFRLWLEGPLLIRVGTLWAWTFILWTGLHYYQATKLLISWCSSMSCILPFNLSKY